MDAIDPIIDRIRSALRDAYGERLERVVLYGSRARGDASEESDYDIAVFIERIGSNWEEFNKLADIELTILEDTGLAIHTMPYPAGSWAHPSAPLMYEIRRDGVDLL
jgi:predicted nucleotidyltransferase